MAFLRIAVFDAAGAPSDALEIWDDLVGSALRNNPDCLHAMVSRRGDTLAVVATWTSEELAHSWMESKPYLDVADTVSARFGMKGRPEPAFLFEGPVTV